ncbi:MAG: riboflavin kinase [Candidatus Peribacteraceae bacterium]|nr:riboflavin kinase [Candidatus Peribacteraceae bacterium]
MTLPISFQASVIPGKGIGETRVGFPTINVSLADVPIELEEGIFACAVKIDDDETEYMGAMHYGPRIVFDGSRSCEVHLIDTKVNHKPGSALIHVSKFLRNIQDFPSIEELHNQIEKDIDECKAVLAVE